jgi:hypothetical protein
MTPVLVHASSNLANHDAVGASILATLNQKITEIAEGSMVYRPDAAPILNRFFADGAAVATGAAGRWISDAPQTVYTAHAWERGIADDRAISHGWLLAGGIPSRIAVISDGQALDPVLRDAVLAHGSNLYQFA